MEPTVVKTVSKNKVSELVYNFASGLVIKESFLQEKKIIAENIIKVMDFKLVELWDCFIVVLFYCCIVYFFIV